MTRRQSAPDMKAIRARLAVDVPLRNRPLVQAHADIEELVCYVAVLERKLARRTRRKSVKIVTPPPAASTDGL